MTEGRDSETDRSVRQSITVQCGVEHAFRTFTADIDGWWPRSHHIGSSPLVRVHLEPRVGGRCYSDQEDGTQCDWGTVLVWEPPSRLVFAWQITHRWGYEPDLSKASEVELRFTPEGDDSTRVELEHRYFSRHGAGGDEMRTAVGGPGGWTGLLALYARKAATAG